LDDEIELADPKFILLGQEEAAKAIRLLAVLIRVAQSRRSDSTPSPPRKARSLASLADGSPPAPSDSGKTRTPETAGGGR